MTAQPCATFQLDFYKIKCYNIRAVRERTQNLHKKNFSKKFEKRVDKPLRICYNKDTKRETATRKPTETAPKKV